MFKALQNGYVLPDSLSKEEWKYIKEHKDENPALAGFAGHGTSFGGKWFCSYANNKNESNYCLKSKNALLNKMHGLYDATFLCMDYREVEIPPNAIVYCDPPYNNTTEYKQLEKFNTNDFWEYIRNISQRNIVLISEEFAPEDFVSIWSSPLKRRINFNKIDGKVAIENLFIINSRVDIINLFNK